MKTYEEHAERHEIEEDAALVARRGTRTVCERPEQVGRRIHVVARIHLRPAQVVPIPIRTQSSLQVQVYWKRSIRVYLYTRRDSSRDRERHNSHYVERRTCMSPTGSSKNPLSYSWLRSRE